MHMVLFGTRNWQPNWLRTGGEQQSIIAEPFAVSLNQLSAPQMRALPEPGSRLRPFAIRIIAAPANDGPHGGLDFSTIGFAAMPAESGPAPSARILELHEDAFLLARRRRATGCELMGWWPAFA